MKNIINYYYGIIVNEYKKREDKFMFDDKDNDYEFVEFFGDVNKLLNNYSLLKINGRQSNEIILNKSNDVLTYYEGRSYILLKKQKFRINKLSLDDINNYDCVVYNKDNLNWKSLWQKKIDYYEFQLEESGNKYTLLKQSFNYYIGMSEIAINLLNFADLKNINHYVCHKRLETTEDLINPLNIIIDNKVRDIAEYIKNKYMNDKITMFEVKSFINKSFFSENEIILFLSRLIYPSYYFDMYEKIYLEKENENNILKIIKKNVSYETFLKEIYIFLKSKYRIPQIEFFET